MEAEVYEFLTQTFLRVFGRDIKPTPSMTAADVAGWDSFAQISIIIATEERFGFEFTTAELDNLGTVGDYVRVVLAKRSA